MARDGKGPYSYRSVPVVTDLDNGDGASTTRIDGGPEEDYESAAAANRWRCLSCNRRPPKKQITMERSANGRGAYVLEKVYRYVGEGAGTFSKVEAPVPEPVDLGPCQAWYPALAVLCIGLVAFAFMQGVLFWTWSTTGPQDRLVPLPWPHWSGRGPAPTAAPVLEQSTTSLQRGARHTGSSASRGELEPVRLSRFESTLADSFGSENGALTWVKARARLAPPEDTLDKVLDFREFQHLARELKPPLTTEQARYVFSVLDKNQDGEVSDVEFFDGLAFARQKSDEKEKSAS